jgi:pimeloyl-ACP methyl ester carboxylesterase
MIDLGGYRVHLYCTGAGSPTVVIVGAGFSFDWSLVQSSASAFARVCVYDPSGTTWSDPGPGRSCPAWVNEVHELVKRAPIGGPYVLTGLSAGAVVARLYANNYPAEVAGLVIVDHAFFPKSAVAPIPAQPPSGLGSEPAVIFQAPVIVSREDEPGYKNLPPRIQQLDRWADSLNPDLPTAETTAGCIALAEAAGKERKQPLGDLPLLVIGTANDAPGYAELQKHLLSLSSDSRQMVAEKSFHSIELSEPQMVVSGILAVTEAVRNHSRLSGVGKTAAPQSTK